MAEEKYNRKNPAVKRILQELKEMQSNPSDDFMSLPLEENIFEWQFAIRGATDSVFEGGIYHGRIQLPAEYPFKPPSFLLLTPNGRFETQTKICLSISNHHPEHWQPSWSVRTALVALIAFMPTSPNGALGSLDYPIEERRKLAVKSREAAPTFGSSERQKLIDEIHEYMLSKAPPVPQGNQISEAQARSAENEDQRGLQNDLVDTTTELHPHAAVEDGIVEEPNETPPTANSNQTSQIASNVPTNVHQLLRNPELRVPKQVDDRLFTWAAFVLAVSILILLLKKFLKANGHGAVFMNES
ncbi:ubiquitin-conjugating enzyme E2 32-like [Primulina huaijiensis]|uniref:ubiquitin-conjugating enzyme E2 32-like n=1 Tax=Primulina huaijiensis TaxID=1492673 RepID=UPI003CC710FC